MGTQAVRNLVPRDQRTEASAELDATGKTKLTDVEKRAFEVGTRLVHYQAISRREVRSVEPLLVMPRPSNAAYLSFVARAVKKDRETRGHQRPVAPGARRTQVARHLLARHPARRSGGPGDRPQVRCQKYSTWLRESSVWVPLRVLLDASPEDLIEAGFPRDKSEAFLLTFKALDEAETAQPGRVEEAKSGALVAAAQALGEAVSPTRYPTSTAMERETYFNETNPFWKAPVGLWTRAGAAGEQPRLRGDSGSEADDARLAWGWDCTSAGCSGWWPGSRLEIVGFTFRVQISGWAPVTNMYETVIWVSLVSAVLGLIFELIYRRTFAALAGSGVALLGTVLAANVPLLDPSIHALQPVLRSNYWLTIHVLTEVSSYAAFALAMGLGMIATMYYLTATYRRSPGYLELAVPLFPGVPMLVAGALGVAVSYGAFGFQWLQTRRRRCTMSRRRWRGSAVR